MRPFVCLEPWMGRADDIGFDKELAEKPNVNKAAPGERFPERLYDSGRRLILPESDLADRNKPQILSECFLMISAAYSAL